MMMSERIEFKRQIITNPTKLLIAALKNTKTTTNLRSKRTNPHADQTLTEFPPSRETGPHPNGSQEILAETPKCTEKMTHPNPSIKTLANALTRRAEQKNKCPVCTYAE